ncbi:MAG: hypothetical protein PHF86_00315 [Candidatus Nanoarchaeia archaeon]|nr:hypothetical protein [Candidatus Nanoarchaeia archaeon]
MEKFTIQGLYYRYEKTDDLNIRKVLSDIKLVKLENKLGKKGYYPLNEKTLKEIIKDPRSISPNFQSDNTEETPIEGLSVYKEITYLVKSSSRFFYKPDIGEIIDQIPYEDLWGSEIKAICISGKHELLEDTDGEHFLAKATLLQ